MKMIYTTTAAMLIMSATAASAQGLGTCDPSIIPLIDKDGGGISPDEIRDYIENKLGNGDYNQDGITDPEETKKYEEMVTKEYENIVCAEPGVDGGGGDGGGDGGDGY